MPTANKGDNRQFHCLRLPDDYLLNVVHQTFGYLLRRLYRFEHRPPP